MEKKKSFSAKVGDFLSGRGFYVVLFACIAVIGVSAWILIATGINASDVNEKATVKITDSVKLPAAAEKETQSTPVSVPEEDEAEEVVSEIREADTETERVFIWPVSGVIGRPYSTDGLIYSKTLSDWRTHDGVDITADLGATVMCVSDGVVSEVYDDDMFGTTVIIDHGDGIRSVYCGLSDTSVVEGEAVAMCASVGKVGLTALAESSDAPHLHFSMTVDGVSVDPTELLPAE